MTAHAVAHRPSGLNAALRWLRRAACATWLSGCAASLPPSYMQARERAAQAYSEGDYAAAARHWQQAARFAADSRNRDWARYRQALSSSRLGDGHEATTLLLALIQQTSDPDLSARSRYDLGRLEARRGEQARALEHWRAVFLTRPQAPIAPAAWRRWLGTQRQMTLGPELTKQLAGYARQLMGTPLAEVSHFSYARQLEASGQRELAIRAYSKHARQHPFPALHWDEALWRAALLQRSAGNPEGALESLAHLLQASADAPAWFGGTRPLLGRARFERGRILRDDLGRHAQAIDEFRRVWQEHTASRWGDDGLWEAALLARRTGRSALGCTLALDLATARPASRFAPCVSLLCPAPSSTAQTACKPHLRARLELANQAHLERR